jgi:cytosine/adenosine deaminase-related metal-dependent hydrolase
MAMTLIKGGKLLSMDPALGEIPNADVLFEGDRILQVGRHIHAPEATVIDASRMIVMPGLVDAHLHTWETGLRGIAGNWVMGDYARNMHANLATRFRPEDIYIANLVGSLNQLACGATTVFDWCHNNPTPDHTDAAIAGLEAAGIRAVFGHGSPKPNPKGGQKHYSEVPHPESEVRRLRAGRLASDEGLLGMAMCILGPHYSIYEVTVQDIQLARKYDLLASCHIGGGLGMNPGGIRRLAQDGVLGPKFNVVHGNNLTDEELRDVIGAGGTVTLTPEPEVQVGFGYPLTGRLVSLGADVSLGVDIECGSSGDMFTVMRLALQFQRMIDNQPFAVAGKLPDKLQVTPRMALRWATVDGARMLGLDGRIGSLTPGKQADIILIRTDDLNLFPVHDPVESIIFHANPSNVDTVFVGGRPVKRGGNLLYKDLSRKQDQLLESGRRIIRDAGLPLWGSEGSAAP